MKTDVLSFAEFIEFPRRTEKLRFVLCLLHSCIVPGVPINDVSANIPQTKESCVETSSTMRLTSKRTKICLAISLLTTSSAFNPLLSPSTLQRRRVLVRGLNDSGMSAREMKAALVELGASTVIN